VGGAGAGDDGVFTVHVPSRKAMAIAKRVVDVLEAFESKAARSNGLGGVDWCAMLYFMACLSFSSNYFLNKN
jgi:hypothetical protein